MIDQRKSLERRLRFVKLENAVQPSHSDEKSSLTYEQLSRLISLSLHPSPTSQSFRELPLIRTIRFKLMRSKKNRKLHCEIEQFCRVYNHFIAVIERYYRLFNKHPSANRLKMLLPKLKRTRRFLWLKGLPSQALQDVVERIDRAYKRFFKERKKGKRCGKPHFKQPENYKSFTLKQAGWELVGEHSLRIGDFVFKFHKSREIPAEKVKTVTVKRDKLGDIYVFFVVKSTEFVPKRCATGKSVGIDFGFDQFLTLSDGTSVDAPMFFKRDLRYIRQLSRSMSRKTHNSNSWNSTRLDLNRAYRAIQHKRDDWHWRLAHELCQKYDLICFETLNFKFFQRKHGKKIQDFGFVNFVKKLKYLAKRYGTQIVFVDRFFPSSQLCNACGYQNPELKDLKIREWVCPVCGASHERDFNASKNILDEGGRALAGLTEFKNFEVIG